MADGVFNTIRGKVLHLLGDADCQNITVRGRVKGLPRMTVVCRAWLVTPGVGIANTTDTLVHYDSSDDPMKMYNPATGLFTIPYTGYYWVSIQHRLNSAAGVVCASIYRNASGGTPQFFGTNENFNGNGAGAKHNRLLDLNAGDTIAANIWQNSGASVTLDTSAFSTKMDVALVCAL